jgi:hypothetical protein
MSKEIIELNRPALRNYLNVPTGRAIKVWSAFEPYISKNLVISQATIEKPVYRVSVDYEINGLKFNIGMITADNLIKNVYKYLDSLSESITAQQITALQRSRNPFIYLEGSYK